MLVITNNTKIYNTLQWIISTIQYTQTYHVVILSSLPIYFLPEVLVGPEPGLREPPTGFAPGFAAVELTDLGVPLVEADREVDFDSAVLGSPAGGAPGAGGGGGGGGGAVVVPDGTKVSISTPRSLII
jgi:hypothetical protein